MTKSDLVQLAGMLAGVAGIAVIVLALLGGLAACGAGLLALALTLWVLGRELDSGESQ